MANYFLNDIALTTSGDISLASNGDIGLANSYETIKTAVNFLISTDKGEYKPDKRVGCNLGTFIGDRILPETFEQMEHSVFENLSKFLLSPSDFKVHVLSLDQDTAGVFIVLAGTYLDPDGNLLTTSPQVLTYAFPFYEGQPTLINIS